MFELKTKIEFGNHAIDKIKELVDQLGSKKVLCITDPGLVRAGVYSKLVGVLEAGQIEYVEYTEVEPDPSISTVNKIAHFAKENQVDCIIAVGGGSPIDAAKGTRILMDNETQLVDCAGVDQVKKISTPLIAVPTTAGTGSEVTKFAVLNDVDRNLKFTIASDLITPSYAILDPVLTIGLPAKMTAATGFDALTHAVEALASLEAQHISDLLALESLRLIFKWLPQAVRQGENVKAREMMLLAQLYAGIAFNNAYLG